MKHSILLTSLLLISGSLAAGSLAACSSDGGSGGASNGGSGGESGSTATGGAGMANGGSGGESGSGGSGGSSAGTTNGGSGGTAVFCDAPGTIFTVNTDNDVNGQPVDQNTPLAQKQAGCNGAACHIAANVATFPPDLESANPETRLIGVAPDSAFCSGGTDIYIDPNNVDNSLLLRVLDANPTCGENGLGTIEEMPFGCTAGSLPHLTDVQKQCIRDWAHYVVAHQQ